MYDILAGKENMESSYLMSKGKALELFPMLKSEGLVGAVVYYDGALFLPSCWCSSDAIHHRPGQHNDARMNVALIMTAVKLGATVANYCGVTELHKDAQGKLVGAKVKDELTGREFNVRAKVNPPFILFSSHSQRAPTCSGYHQRDWPVRRCNPLTRQSLAQAHREAFVRRSHYASCVLRPRPHGSSRPCHLGRPRHLLSTLGRRRRRWDDRHACQSERTRRGSDA